MIVVAFVVAYVVIWFGPTLLNGLGLGEFVFVGQVCLVVLALSVLEKVFARLHSDEH